MLRRQLIRYSEWLNQKLPEDVYQEVALFLLEQCPPEVDGEKIDYTKLPKEELYEVIRAFSRHMYHFMSDYGVTPAKYRRERPFVWSEDQEYDESYDTALAVDFWEKYNQTNWFRDNFEFCRKMIVDDVSESEKQWEAFDLYIKGRNTQEIGWRMKITEKEARELLRSAITKIRTKGTDENLEYHIPLATHIGAEDIPKRNTDRLEVVVDPNSPLMDIMLKFNVSKATASRMRDRAQENDGKTWYVPYYQPKAMSNVESGG